MYTVHCYTTLLWVVLDARLLSSVNVCLLRNNSLIMRVSSVSEIVADSFMKCVILKSFYLRKEICII